MANDICYFYFNVRKGAEKYHPLGAGSAPYMVRYNVPSCQDGSCHEGLGYFGKDPKAVAWNIQCVLEGSVTGARGVALKSELLLGDEPFMETLNLKELAEIRDILMKNIKSGRSRTTTAYPV